MDEPLSNLDAKLRVQMRADIAALQERLGVTTVYVTHDQVEAMTLGHRIAVLRDGELQQCDEPRAVYERPANVFVAGFIGSPAMNLVGAPVADGACELNGVRLELPSGVAESASALGRVIVGLRPESLEPGTTGISARVEVVEELGSEAYAFCAADLPEGEQRLIARVDSRRPPERGERLTLQPRADEVHVFDPASGNRLG
jgi:multiple sugar transport system ATP-binding protein